MPSDLLVNSFEDSKFEWFHHPEQWTVAEENVVVGETEGTGGCIEHISPDELRFQAPAKKDFWARTFYSPLLIKNDATGYLYPVAGDVEVTASVTFSLNAISQFDQAGILIYVDDEHWVKCGIEYCDELPRLSVVVCNRGFSDWSTQVWSSTSAHLRVHKVLQSSSFVVEAAPVSDESTAERQYQFVRIAHLASSSPTFRADDPSTFPTWRLGPFAACPIAQRGCSVSFRDFAIGPRLAAAHSSEL
jgi:hypothetical protein